MPLREGLSFNSSKMFTGCLEPGGSNTNIGLGLGDVPMFIGFLGAVMGVGLLDYYKKSERPLAAGSEAARVGDYLVETGEVLLALARAGSPPPPKLPENMFWSFCH